MRTPWLHRRKVSIDEKENKNSNKIIYLRHRINIRYQIIERLTISCTKSDNMSVNNAFETFPKWPTQTTITWWRCDEYSYCSYNGPSQFVSYEIVRCDLISAFHTRYRRQQHCPRTRSYEWSYRSHMANKHYGISVVFVIFPKYF